MVGGGASLHGRLLLGGTDGSNPVPSSGESVSAVNSGAVGEKPRAFAPVCTASGTRDGDELADTRSFSPFSLKGIDAVSPRRFEASQRRAGRAKVTAWDACAGAPFSLRGVCAAPPSRAADRVQSHVSR